MKESTVHTVLKRLEAQGLITHPVENRTYIYSSRDSCTVAAARPEAPPPIDMNRRHCAAR